MGPFAPHKATVTAFNKFWAIHFVWHSCEDQILELCPFRNLYSYMFLVWGIIGVWGRGGVKSPGISRYHPKGVLGKGVGNDKNASEMLPKCVKNAPQWVCFYREKRNVPKWTMRLKCVTNARNIWVFNESRPKYCKLSHLHHQNGANGASWSKIGIETSKRCFWGSRKGFWGFFGSKKRHFRRFCTTFSMIVAKSRIV